MSATLLIWNVLLDGTGLSADAFGVTAFYRIRGRPGRWNVIVPRESALHYQEGFQSQASACRWAEEDYRQRALDAAANLVDAQNGDTP